MRAQDIILRTRSGQPLAADEISFLIDGLVSGSIPEYQVSAWLMAVYFRGLTSKETSLLTKAMIDSGNTLDLSSLGRITVDKHSTGGVGDKTSLIIAPLAAAMGVVVPMMSGRGLGNTGGTLDKLESIRGFQVLQSPENARSILDDCGFVMMGQSPDMVPADRILYALRDVTGTVESVPLITASILSKKKAEGTAALMLDVKHGSGAFMQKIDDARILAQSIVETGHELGMNVQALLSDMDSPLGYMVGNFLEVEEVWHCLQGPGPSGYANWNVAEALGQRFFSGASARLMELSIGLAARMAVMGGVCADLESATVKALEVLADGQAFVRFTYNIRRQGGDPAELQELIGVYRACCKADICSESSGWLSRIDAGSVGYAAVLLGAGRDKASDPVLPDVGLQFYKELGARVEAGERIVTLFARDEQRLEKAMLALKDKITIGEAPVRPEPVITEEVRLQ